MLPAAPIWLSVSQAALIRNRDSDFRQSTRQHWSSHFLRTTLIVGLPIGLTFGMILAILLHYSAWTIGGIEVICASLFGASLVYADEITP
jgi:Mg/Co/Ni transporter MgtE